MGSRVLRARELGLYPHIPAGGWMGDAFQEAPERVPYGTIPVDGRMGIELPKARELGPYPSTAKGAWIGSAFRSYLIAFPMLTPWPMHGG